MRQILQIFNPKQKQNSNFFYRQPSIKAHPTQDTPPPTNETNSYLVIRKHFCQSPSQYLQPGFANTLYMIISLAQMSDGLYEPHEMSTGVIHVCEGPTCP